MLCDAGANVQPKAAHLYQYAVMASMYLSAMKGIEQSDGGDFECGDGGGEGDAAGEGGRAGAGDGGSAA